MNLYHHTLHQNLRDTLLRQSFHAREIEALISLSILAELKSSRLKEPTKVLPSVLLCPTYGSILRSQLHG